MEQDAQTLSYEQAAFKRAKRIAKALGAQGEIYLSIGSTRFDRACDADVSIYTDGMSRGLSVRCSAPTFTQALDQAEAWILKHVVVLRDTTIRKMALAIIELTDEHGCCKRVDLMRRFSDDEVDEFAEAACSRASEMCANSPFEVQP